MKKHSFRFNKIRRYRQQNQRLAAVNAAKLKTELDQATAKLVRLEDRLVELTADYQRTMKQEPQMLHNVYLAIEALHAQITEAQTEVEQCEEVWKLARADAVQKKIEAESMDHLHRVDLESHDNQIAKFHMNELNETTLRRWIDSSQQQDT